MSCARSAALAEVSSDPGASAVVMQISAAEGGETGVRSSATLLEITAAPAPCCSELQFISELGVQNVHRGGGGIFEHARQIQGANKRRFLPFPCLRVPCRVCFIPQLKNKQKPPLICWWRFRDAPSTSIPTWEKGPATVLQLLVISLKSLQLSTGLLCSVFCSELVGCSSTDPPQNLLLLLLLQHK